MANGEQSGVHTLNEITGSGLGIALSLGMDYYVDSVGTKELNAFRTLMGPSSHIEHRFNELFTAKNKRWILPKSREYIRATLKNIPKIGGWFESAASMSELRANRVLIRDVLDNTQKYGLDDPKHAGVLAKLQRARTFKNISVGGVQLMAFTMGMDIAKGTINSFISRGKNAGTRSFSMATANQFMDSSMAYTTRQAAMRAIQNSQASVRRALGNEAAMLHVST